jgi:hypothetical protein
VAKAPLRPKRENQSSEPPFALATPHSAVHSDHYATRRSPPVALHILLAHCHLPHSTHLAAAAHRLRPSVDYATAHERLATGTTTGTLTQSTPVYAIRAKPCSAGFAGLRECAIQGGVFRV